MSADMRLADVLPCLILTTNAFGCAAEDTGKSPAMVPAPNAERGGAPGGQPTVESPRTAVPASLVGEWGAGSTIPSNYYNRVSGAWAPPTGAAESYKFTAMGDYQLSRYAQTTVLTCSLSVLRVEEGTVTVKGTSITFHPTWGRVKNEHPCGPYNSEYDIEKTVVTFTWKVETTDGKTKLVLRAADGKESTLVRY